MYDITIIGAGRVGLPLALMLESKGFKVAVKEIDDKIIQSIKNKKMPFLEPGFDKLMQKTKIATFKNEMPEANAYVITVGTPLNLHIETDLSQVNKVVDELINKINLKGKLIVLRSTVAPHTSQYFFEYIARETGLKPKKDFFLAMCPERIAQGQALKELTELPQIIGVEDDESFRLARKIFSRLVSSGKILRASFLEAELAKLFTNIYRYINFSIPNYFLMLAHTFDVDAFRLFDIMNKDYQRNKGLRRPGLTAGTCLRKDFGMINENYFQTDLILQAYKINEFMPKFVADLVKKQTKHKRVGILGYAFKANIDDTRDTLVAKLVSYINRNLPSKINISDYYLPLGKFEDGHNDVVFENMTESKLIKSSDIIFIAIDHAKYRKLNKKSLKGKIIVDIWRVLGGNLIVE